MSSCCTSKSSKSRSKHKKKKCSTKIVCESGNNDCSSLIEGLGFMGIGIGIACIFKNACSQPCPLPCPQPCPQPCPCPCPTPSTDGDDVITMVTALVNVPYSVPPVPVVLRFIRRGETGKTVRLEIPRLTGQFVQGAAGASFMSWPAGTIPADIRPNANTRMVVWILSNGSRFTGNLQIVPSGAMTLDPVGTTWTAGLCGLEDQIVFSYNLP